MDTEDPRTTEAPPNQPEAFGQAERPRFRTIPAIGQGQRCRTFMLLTPVNGTGWNTTDYIHVSLFPNGNGQTKMHIKASIAGAMETREMAMTEEHAREATVQSAVDEFAQKLVANAATRKQ